MKSFLTVFCYALRLVPCLIVIREVSPSSRWEQVKRPTADMRRSTLEVSIWSLSSEIRENLRRGVGKVVGVKGDEGHRESATG